MVKDPSLSHLLHSSNNISGNGVHLRQLDKIPVPLPRLFNQIPQLSPSNWYLPTALPHFHDRVRGAHCLAALLLHLTVC